MTAPQMPESGNDGFGDFLDEVEWETQLRMANEFIAQVRGQTENAFM